VVNCIIILPNGKNEEANTGTPVDQPTKMMVKIKDEMGNNHKNENGLSKH
jgi:hypothetical protein